MAELDHMPISNKSICKDQHQIQQQRVQPKPTIRSSKLTQPNAARQISKTPVKIAPHPVKMTVNNNLAITSVGGIVSNNNSVTSIVQSSINNNNKSHLKAEDCVTARLRSSANNNNNNQR